MKDFLRGQLAYNHAINTAVIDYYLENTGGLSGRAIRLMSHVLLVHKLWNHMITGDPPVTDWWAALEVTQMREIDDENRTTTLRILEDFDPEHVITVPNPRGGSTDFQVGDIVFHIFNHSNYHRGQINTELRTLGLEPLKTDYIFWKAMQRQ
ncbi:MAG: DinB family protein [Saprospiraceae bacterium]|nr:DinB family protein [Saprospiraceae bacterium]